MITWLLRIVLAASLLGSAGIHVYLWFDGFRDIDVVGPLFLVNAAAGAVLAIAVLAWFHWLPLLGAVGFGLATLAAYVLSLTVGFFGTREYFRTQGEIWSLITEIACVIFGVALLVLLGRQRVLTQQTGSV